MIIISDTTPIISLLKAEQLDLLQKLFDEVIIPNAVFHELISNQRFQDEAQKIKDCPYIYVEEVISIKSVDIFRRVTGLDAGESEAIVMADEKKADLLLMDERKGRIVAKQMGLTITGTVGILLQAFDEELLNADEIKKSMIKLRECGIRISESLYKLILDHINTKD